MNTKAIPAQGPVDVFVGPVVYKVTAPDGVVVYLESPLSFAKHCTQNLYALPSRATPELIDAVCRATLMSKTTAEFAVLAVLDALGALPSNAGGKPTDAAGGRSA